MEGIMTGIKPRESFNEKGMSDAMRDDLKSIQSRVNLIDAFSGAGASPLADPLTQFLLQTGQNLIGGTAAGGTKLQEIVGATKDPLNKAIAAQARKTPLTHQPSFTTHAPTNQPACAAHNQADAQPNQKRPTTHNQPSNQPCLLRECKQGVWNG